MRDDLLIAAKRRRLLMLAAASLPAAASAQAPVPEPVAEPAPSPVLAYPVDVGRKFNADGSVRPFAGNTFLGHIGQQGTDFDNFDAWLDIYRDMPRHAFARKLALVPPSSWHVTLIGGINDTDRRGTAWPEDLSRETPIDEVHRILQQRLVRRRTPPLAACHFVIDTERRPRPRIEGSLGIPLRPADAATAARLSTARDELAELIRLRREDHDRYRFHVTIGYLFKLLDADEAAAMATAAGRWMDQLAARGPLRITGFDFCVLRDMYAYRALRAV